MIDATTETEMTTTAETETTEDLLPGDLANFGWIEDIVNQRTDARICILRDNVDVDDENDEVCVL